MNPDDDIEAVILAGGKSSRMGQDKGLMLLNGKPMISYVTDLVKSLNLPARIISHNDDYKKLGYCVIPDLIPEKGPLGGLYTALETSVYKSVLLLSCDSPFITADIIKQLLSKKIPDFVTVASFQTRLYPLCALYPRSLKLKAKTNIDQNNLKLATLIQSSDHTEVIFDEHLTSDPKALNNINTPADLQRTVNSNQMEIKVLLFGLLAEYCGSRNVTLSDVADTDELLKQLGMRFPRLSSMKFTVSVDRRIIHKNTLLNGESEVALLPPFSGG
ncbi:MAG: molybdenum cofactor guanylyltransferase [Bacteroidetes bacterium]|jgi:molybdopterin-guanine dinucleotide biosynthesis protein A|nr:molybdenum cofactor guanylyltransferase [Bacteroidota bacterium]